MKLSQKDTCFDYLPQKMLESLVDSFCFAYPNRPHFETLHFFKHNNK